METQLKRWGNSHGIRLSKAILEQARLKDGDRVEVTVRDHEIRIAPARPRYTLDALVKGIQPGNRHGEESFGVPEGEEAW